MSAYLCTPETFAYLAAVARRNRVTLYTSGAHGLELEAAAGRAGVPADFFPRFAVVDEFTERTAAHLLYLANVASLQARYPNGWEDMAGPFSFRPYAGTVNAVWALKSVACLEYQSCEAYSWRASAARALLAEIEQAAIGMLPGWDDAPWGVTSEDLAGGRSPYAGALLSLAGRGIGYDAPTCRPASLETAGVRGGK